MDQLVVAVVGPTATGKSALGIALAEALDGEVVNADSMQLYRGMDIGTAKVPPEQRGGVPHQVLDIWDVTQTASVAEYQRLARAAVGEIFARGKVPVLVGGSGLYVRAVLDELDFPGTDPLIRGKLESELAEYGPAPLHRRLQEVDPVAARAILPSNGRRIVRALEVISLTGRPFVARLPEQPRPAYRSVQVALDRDVAELDERVASRVGQMWEDGLVGEVRRLAEQGLRQGRTARAALGYQQVLSFLAGEVSETAAYAETIRATRRYVRRQRSWFRRDPRPVWLAAGQPDLVKAALAVVEQAEPAPPGGER